MTWSMKIIFMDTVEIFSFRELSLEEYVKNLTKFEKEIVIYKSTSWFEKIKVLQKCFVTSFILEIMFSQIVFNFE